MSTQAAVDRTATQRSERGRRWVGYVVAALVFAVVCMGFSYWQYERGQQAVAANALIDANYNSDPKPITTILPTLSSFDASQEWTRVSLTGTYDRTNELLVRDRAFNGSPGFEVLTPLQLADGSEFIVDRGWVPTGNEQDAPDSVPAAPSGVVTVIARLQASEPPVPGRVTTGNEVGTIQLSAIEERLGNPAMYTGAYGLIDSQDPAPSTAPTQTITAPPVVDEGIHWSYMIQWPIFALLAFFGLFYAIRTERRKRAEDLLDDDDDLLEAAPGHADPRVDAGRPFRAAAPTRKPRARRSDAEIEDEIIDASEVFRG